MRNKLNICLIIGISALSIGFLQSCKNKDPSVLKIYFKDENGKDFSKANTRVVIVGDVDSDPITDSYVDTAYSEESNIVQINMDKYFDKVGGEDAVGYFDLYVKSASGKYGEGRVRCRKHLTAVETIYLNK